MIDKGRASDGGKRLKLIYVAVGVPAADGFQEILSFGIAVQFSSQAYQAKELIHNPYFSGTQ